MTEQYTQPNINVNGDYVEFASDVGSAEYEMSPGDSVLSVDSSAAAATVYLPPLSSAGDCGEFTIYSSAAGSVTVEPAAGDPPIVNGTSPNPILLEGGSLTLKSSTLTGMWYVVGNTI